MRPAARHRPLRRPRAPRRPRRPGARGWAQAQRAAAVVLGAAALVVGGCALPGEPTPRPFGPRFYSSGSSRRVLCSKAADRNHEWPAAALTASLVYARDRQSVLHTFAPGNRLDLDALSADFDYAAALGVPMVTYRDLEAHRGAGWAFSVDGDEVDAWYAWRDQLARHHARLTFFVGRFARLTEAQRGKLRELVADGHDVEAAGITAAPEYVAAHGLARYLADEVRPSRQALVDEGYEAVAFAYPYGAHTAEIDGALLGEFRWLRATGAGWCLK